LPYVLAGVELEDVGAVFASVQEFCEPLPDAGEFLLGQPALAERLLPAGFVSEQEAMRTMEPPRVGNVVADEIEGAGGIFHAAQCKPAGSMNAARQACRSADMFP
jgi:hypothetical protein